MVSLFYDLHVCESQLEPQTQRERVAQALRLGFDGMGLVHQAKERLLEQDRCAIKPTELAALLSATEGVGKAVEASKAKVARHGNAYTCRQFTRLNFPADDVATAQAAVANTAVTSTYDLLAVQPRSERLFALACTSLDVDIISLDLSRRLPFRFKPALVKAALARGLHFEVCFSAALWEAGARRQLFTNAQALCRETRGRNIVVSSCARTVMELRQAGSDASSLQCVAIESLHPPPAGGPYDVMNMATLFGLTQQQAQHALSRNAEAALQHAAARKAYRGLLTIQWAGVDGKPAGSAGVQGERLGPPNNGGASASSQKPAQQQQQQPQQQQQQQQQAKSLKRRGDARAGRTGLVVRAVASPVKPSAGPQDGPLAKNTKIQLGERVLPRQWYNILADLDKPMPPPLNPKTMQPVTVDDLVPIFPMGLIEQEVSLERYIDIPDEVREVYKLWRPTPMYRARRLEKALQTPARIYYKYEGVSPAGSHKPNTAVPQAYYNKREGVKRLTTETGAGQWGASLAFACSLFDLECEVRSSFDSKPYRRILMEVWGATVHSSPSDLTQCGRDILARMPDTPGSLGIAISEAVEVAAQDPDAKYALGSVLNHVMLHQTVIGEEALLQLEKIGEVPDLLVGCTGGGSNFAGLAFPFIREKLASKMNPVIRAVEPAACPSLSKGKYAYDFGDTAGLTPLIKMHTLGSQYVPDPIHAGGLRYHGMAPMVSHVYNLGLMEAVSIPQRECFEAAVKFARTEGILPAPESSHAVAAAVREAERCREAGEEKVVLIALSGHGLHDMTAYAKYMEGAVDNIIHTDEQLHQAWDLLPKIPEGF
ncbi:hypothetical protein N2152v2_007401 [Parachlorella kessleri]